MTKRGAPRRNLNRESHGLVTIQNAIKRRTRRGRNFVDRRSGEGKEALCIQAGLVEDQGGLNALTTARFIAISELTHLYYLGLMMDRSTRKYLDKNPTMNKPRALAKLFSYRQPVTNCIEKYLALLGLDKRARPAKSLEEILSEDD